MKKIPYSEFPNYVPAFVSKPAIIELYPDYVVI